MADKNKFKSTSISKIDSRTEYIEPIDYSFKDLMNLQEATEMQPRYTNDAKEPPRKEGKYVSLGLKLGYNALTDLNGLFTWVEHIFAFPKQLASLDLSFNCLTDIPSVILEFESLKCLYLHGNKIKDIEQCDKLEKLHHLNALTIHGNPIENLPGFRLYIISKLSQIKHLNFAGVSKAERQTAKTWSQIHAGKLKNYDNGAKFKQIVKKNVDEED